MTKPFPPPILPETTLQNAKTWLNIIRYRESGTVIQLQDDCEYRVLEIIENKLLLRAILGPYFRKYLFAYVPVDKQHLLQAIHETLVSLCLSKKIGTKGTMSGLSNKELLNEIELAGYDVGLFISHIPADIFSSEQQPLCDLEYLVRTGKNLSVIVFSETDITHPSYHRLADKCSFLFDHVIPYPLYDRDDSLQFLSHYLSDWHITMPDKIRLEVSALCGGHLWLIHHIARYLRDHPDSAIPDACTDGGLKQKLNAIWHKLTPSQQTVLRNVYFQNLSDIDKRNHDVLFLSTIRYITESDGRYTLGIPLLSTHIEDELITRTWQFRNEKIYIGDRDLTDVFTKNERQVLQLFLRTKNTVITREHIAQTIWNASWEQRYSDWAIDRLVYRIRSKLKPIQGADKLLKTIKKKGFSFG